MKRLPQHLNIAFFYFYLKKQTSYDFENLYSYILVKINFDVDYSNHKGITIKAVNNYVCLFFTAEPAYDCVDSFIK